MMQILFGWPNGITTGNLIASAIWVVIAAIVVWLFRDLIGKKLGAWLHKHHQEHTKWLEARSKTSNSDSGSQPDLPSSRSSS